MDIIENFVIDLQNSGFTMDQVTLVVFGGFFGSIFSCYIHTCARVCVF